MLEARAGLPRACPLCGKVLPRLYRMINGIRIVACRGCSLRYRDAIPSDLDALYQEAYFHSQDIDWTRWAGSGDYVKDGDRLLRTFDEHIADMERLKRPGKLLDVGCALGYLLEAARRRGWQVEGIDISQFAAEYARREWGITVHVGTTDSVSLPDGGFDVVSAFDYIEHVSDPRNSLHCFRRWLRDDDILVLTTPNAASWRACLRSGTFPGFRDRTHLTYFTPRTISRLLHETGFQTVAIHSDATFVTASGLRRIGVSSADGLRTLINRAAPGLKKAIRRALGKLIGGNGMKIYARPAAGGA